MLINRLQDGEAKGDSESGPNNITNYAYEYQTANELFDLMTKEHCFDETGDDSLTTRDLVILYENIEIGTKLLSDAKQVKRSNRLIETIVYNDESESEASDNYYSNADLLNLCRANDETLDLLQSNSSYENTLCRKISRMEIQTSIYSPGCDKCLSFKDIFLKDHFKNLRASCMDFNSQILPSTLLDYLCCKGLEDHYTSNMDSIIRYVTHTIDQLKRISNGDYLTERAKELWKEVQEENIHTNIIPKSAMMLATRSRFPMHIRRKSSGTPSNWDDMVHSEVDLRSLTKLLEKKIILEIPKIICGSFKLFSKQCAEKIIIRCKQSCSLQSVDEKTSSQVGVVLQLERSKTGQVMSKINSIMIVDAIPKEDQKESGVILALPYFNSNESKDGMEIIRISNTNSQNEEMAIEESNKLDCSAGQDTFNSKYNSDKEDPREITEITLENTYTGASSNDDEDIENKTCRANNFEYPQQDFNGTSCSEEINEAAEMLESTLIEVIDSTSAHELSHRSLVCDDLHHTMRSLVMPDTLPEEVEDSFTTPIKNKSPTRVRVKSPYENKSRTLEEKKRKKLLEIKERRERKRNALNENKRITKHKFNNRSAIVPQASRSVTKLSISNKSFYNDIYGKNLELEKKINNTRYRKTEHVSDVLLHECDNNDYIRDIIELPSKNKKKHLNKDLYLDDAVTEMETTGSTSKASSAVPDELNTVIPKNHVDPSIIEINEPHTGQFQEPRQILDTVTSELSSDGFSCVNKKSISAEKVIDSTSRLTTTDDCRESIDKLYDLMNKLENSISTKNDYCTADIKTKKSIDIDIADAVVPDLNIYESESDSLKHQSVSSNPSNMSFLKPPTKSQTRYVEPKVIISSRNRQNTKEYNKTSSKTHHIPHGTRATQVDENPLKAISQLLHDIENVQKNKKKTTFDTKTIKKSEETQKENRVRLRFNIDNKRQSSERPTADKYLHLNSNISRAVPRTNLSVQSTRPLPKPAIEDRHNNITKKNISDIIDEVKEARGEAVRGPTRLNSRLNTLAQPKKTYVQAHNKEYQSRYGRSVAADRSQRLAAAERSPSTKSKQKRGGHESSIVKPPPAATEPPIALSEKVHRKRPRSRSPNQRAHANAKYTQKHPNGRISSNPKPTAALESSMKSHLENSAKTLLQPLTHAKLRDLTTGSRFQPPSHSLEHQDSINTIISTIPIDYKKSEPNMKMDKKSSSSVKLDKKHNVTAEDGSLDEEEELYYEQSTVKSTISKDSELARLESALQSQNTSGVFHKRLRMKNLTLTPKPSSQHMFIVHTGDGSSVVLKSKISQNFKVNTSKSDINYSMQSISRYISNIPLQMFAVAYAFQQYQSFNSKLHGKDVLRRNGSIVSFTKSFIDKPIQKKISDISTMDNENKVTENNRTSKSKILNNTELIYSTSATDVSSKKRDRNDKSCSEIMCITEGDYGGITKPSSEGVNISTSLDILVELLGEIKNITTCQSQMPSQEYESKEIKDIFNNTSFRNKDVKEKNDIDASTSVQNDLNTFAQLNNDTQELYPRTFLTTQSNTAVSSCNKVMLLDKEIYVKLNEKEYENRVTEISSQIFKLHICRSTSITNSLQGVCSRSSDDTMYSLSEHRPITPSTSIVSEGKPRRIQKKKCDHPEKLLVKCEDTKVVSKSSVMFRKNKCSLVKYKPTLDRRVKRVRAQHHINVNSYSDHSILKLKRDVLVALYSILVVTIFAALSLPQVA